MGDLIALELIDTKDAADVLRLDGEAYVADPGDLWRLRLWIDPAAIKSKATEPEQVVTTSPMPAAAWFADPSDPALWRWWDGTAWTEHTAPR